MNKNPLLFIFTVILTAGIASFSTWAFCKNDSLDNNESLLNRAVAREKESKYDAAELLYRDILKENPTNTQAHLRLASLLHQNRHDYLGATHHYMSYLDISPESDLAPTIKERLASAKADLRAQWLRADLERHQATLLAECDALKDERLQLKDDLRKQKELITEKETFIKELERRIENLNRMVEEMKALDVKTPTPTHNFEAIKNIDMVPSEASQSLDLEGVADEAKAISSDDEIAGIRDLANLMITEEDGGQAKINEATRLAVEGVSDTENIIATPVPGKEYTVRPRETYYSIARDAYGAPEHWKKIRDANRGPTNPDGRLYAGEKIKIPLL